MKISEKVALIWVGLFPVTSVWALSLSSASPEMIGQYMGSHGALWSLSAFFLLGILLAFTPCVLPMVPILSGIIVGQAQMQPRRAFSLSLSYVLGMAVTYAVAGLLAGYLGSTVQTMMQQPWIIISFSLVFVFLALSMFGLYEIRLPVRLQPKRQDGRGGLIAAALMGILSTLIVSPCVTAPLITVLAFIGQAGHTWEGGLILFVMALGMGLPLLLVGAGLGRFLPKSGQWMVRVKQLFGLLMLLMAVWMVSRLLPMQSTQSAVFKVVHSMTEIQAQLDKAKAQRQPVFVEFYAGWCSDCQAMDRKVFNQPEVIAALDGAINLRVDISEKTPSVAAIRATYSVLGIPAMRFYRANGDAITGLNSDGQIDKQQMMALLEQFAAKRQY